MEASRTKKIKTIKREIRKDAMSKILHDISFLLNILVITLDLL